MSPTSLCMKPIAFVDCWFQAQRVTFLFMRRSSVCWAISLWFIVSWSNLLSSSCFFRNRCSTISSKYHSFLSAYRILSALLAFDPDTPLFVCQSSSICYGHHCTSPPCIHSTAESMSCSPSRFQFVSSISHSHYLKLGFLSRVSWSSRWGLLTLSPSFLFHSCCLGCCFQSSWQTVLDSTLSVCASACFIGKAYCFVRWP